MNFDIHKEPWVITGSEYHDMRMDGSLLKHYAKPDARRIVVDSAPMRYEASRGREYVPPKTLSLGERLVIKHELQGIIEPSMIEAAYRREVAVSWFIKMYMWVERMLCIPTMKK